MRRTGMLALIAAIGTIALAAQPARADGLIQWEDTYISYRHLWQDKQPGYAGNVQEDAVNISYANGWTYGSNFVSLDLENFGHQDPANTIYGPTSAKSDSFELYGVFRTVASGNKIFHTDAFSFGPIRDVGLELGFDVDTQDDQFASYKRLVVFGPQFAIAVPKGFWNISLHLSHEWNTNAYLPNNMTSFDVAPEIETAWEYPFHVGPVPVKFAGFLNVIGPKGKGNEYDTYHRVEILAHPKLLVDVGEMIGMRHDALLAGIGYEYWHNKFGNVKPLPGTEQNAVFAEVGYNF